MKFSHHPPGRAFDDICIVTRTSSFDDVTDELFCDVRSLRSWQAAEFEARVAFVDGHPLFAKWPPKYRRQLSMSLRRETGLRFDQTVVKQGDAADIMYFIAKSVCSSHVKGVVAFQLMTGLQETLPLGVDCGEVRNGSSAGCCQVTRLSLMSRSHSARQLHKVTAMRLFHMLKHAAIVNTLQLFWIFMIYWFRFRHYVSLIVNSNF
jgi:hypothetical protein